MRFERAILLSPFWLQLCYGQVAPPVKACYNNSIWSIYSSPPPVVSESLESMVKRKAMESFEWVFLTKTHVSTNCGNVVKDAKYNFTATLLDPGLLNGTTYWVNDYLHVGHVHYDIGLIAVAQNTKLDRIIHQRSACHGTLCTGIGSVESFYKGYFAALLAAGNQIHVPVYIRFQNHKNVNPLYFSTNASTDYYNETAMKSWRNPITLYQKTFFEKVIRRTNLRYGSIGALSAESVQRFKAAAYALIDCSPPLTTYFDSGPPYKILFAFRSGSASRKVENMDEVVQSLATEFPQPDYQLRLFNTSNPYLTFQEQLKAVAESHVVIANHGAFEGNMIYMRNHSLLLELFGHYGNNEIHTFQRLAVMFGLHYARLHSHSLTDHQAPWFNLSRVDISDITDTIREYFDVKPYLRNTKDGLK